MTKKIIAEFILDKLKELEGFRDAVYPMNSDDAEEINVTDADENEFIISIQQ